MVIVHCYGCGKHLKKSLKEVIDGILEAREEEAPISGFLCNTCYNSICK